MSCLSIFYCAFPIPSWIAHDFILLVAIPFFNCFYYRKTYPDYTIEIIRQFEDGETVVSEFIMKGTHKGEFIGITPTNKIIEMKGVDIDKIVNGKIVEHGGAVNTFEAFWENGLIKPV